jgi:hypothetical protein
MSTCGVNQRQKYMEMSSAGMLYFATLNVLDLIRQDTLIHMKQSCPLEKVFNKDLPGQ